MSFFKSLFNKSNKEAAIPLDLSIIAVDMHSHLIPGIDDGSQTMDDTIGMLYKFKQLGYRKIITTPHTMSGFYPNTSEIILEGLEQVREKLKEINLDIQLEVASEYYFDDFFLKLMNSKPLLTLDGKRVLFELPFTSKPNNINESIFEMIKQGYQPVLAHYERYLYYIMEGVEPARTFRGMGVEIQMNINSLTGHYGPHIQKQAELLVDNNLIDFVSTDCHRIDHLNLMENSLTMPYLSKLNALLLKNTELL